MANLPKLPGKESASSLAARVRLLRTQLAITQQKMAADIGTDQKEISLVEHGKFPSKRMLQGLISKYAINAHWLLMGQGQMFAQPTPASDAKRARETKESYSAGNPGRARNLARALQETINLLESGGEDEALGKALRAIFNHLTAGSCR